MVNCVPRITQPHKASFVFDTDADATDIPTTRLVPGGAEATTQRMVPGAVDKVVLQVPEGAARTPTHAHDDASAAVSPPQPIVALATAHSISHVARPAAVKPCAVSRGRQYCLRAPDGRGNLSGESRCGRLRLSSVFAPQGVAEVFSYGRKGSKAWKERQKAKASQGGGKFREGIDDMADPEDPESKFQEAAPRSKILAGKSGGGEGGAVWGENTRVQLPWSCRRFPCNNVLSITPPPAVRSHPAPIMPGACRWPATPHGCASAQDS